MDEGKSMTNKEGWRREVMARAAIAMRKHRNITEKHDCDIG